MKQISIHSKNSNHFELCQIVGIFGGNLVFIKAKSDHYKNIRHQKGFCDIFQNAVENLK